MHLTIASFFRSPAFRTFWDSCLDTFFPVFCLGCGAYGTALCDHCLQIFPRRLEQRCPTCVRNTTPRGEVCFDCVGKSALDGLFAGSIYRFPLVSHTLHTFKYRFIAPLASSLGTWLAERVQETNLPLPDAIIPVPLHPRRLRFRGFNQSLLIAEVLADTLTPGLDTLVLANVLLRTRYTKPQMKTQSKEERQGNLTGAFTIAPEYTSLIQDKSIWLIDDVSTTGTTLEECALVLKKSGAKSVFGIVLAR
ncbi:MAG: ComF family protein [Candidatus Moranbacteria bacterium]|nr:ComF family protein [Candidatus Moranbacteria bacterium]MDD3965252.1 ComF family protein [Candidatus Moranbacteria bacterium]